MPTRNYSYECNKLTFRLTNAIATSCCRYFAVTRSAAGLPIGASQSSRSSLLCCGLSSAVTVSGFKSRSRIYYAREFEPHLRKR
jgi:hypothetical protein